MSCLTPAALAKYSRRIVYLTYRTVHTFTDVVILSKSN